MGGRAGAAADVTPYQKTSGLKMRHLLVHDEADQDVAERADHFAEYSLRVAIRFLHAVRKAYEVLLNMPGMGAIRDFPNPNYAACAPGR